MNKVKLDYTKSGDLETLRIFARHRESQIAQLQSRLAKAKRKATKKVNMESRLRAIETILESSSNAKAKEASTARLTLQEVAKELDVDPRTVRRYIESGKLKSYRLGKGDRPPIRITRRDLDFFLEAMESDVAQARMSAKRAQAFS